MAALFKTPKPPQPPQAVAMPDPEDQRARMAKRMQMDAARGRGGRDATILGTPGYGNDYASKKLGGGSAA